MGSAPSFVPETLDREVIDEIVLVDEEDAFDGCRQIARKEGLLAGISSGAVAIAALEIAKRAEHQDAVIICMFVDTGQRYLSVKGLFD
ncbi:MAG: pyridoxal-phosphate dependent enzyme [Chloroflexi bacterium]|nr:pyridoxal-phosphate dependent enzyme [Chloroflexota bacterium]